MHAAVLTDSGPLSDRVYRQGTGRNECSITHFSAFMVQVGMEDGDVIDCMAEQQGGTSETNAIGFDGSTQFNHSRPGVHMNS